MAIERCLIIGSGCAGLTAGIYAARANLNPLILGGLVPGGQLMLTTDVENFPGFEKAVMGPDLMESMRRQCQRLGVRFNSDQVERVDFKQKPLKLWNTDGKEYQAHSVIIATGANAKWLGLPSEEKLRGKGVSACATCDGFFFKGKELAVVGGGDTAMEEATYLTNFASSVTVIHRRDQLRASQAMQEKAKKNPKIRFIWNAAIEEILGSDSVTGVKLKDLTTGKSSTLNCQGVFVAIGHVPATHFLKGQLSMDDSGYIHTLREGTVFTDIPGVFACGDCVDHRYRQAVTAAGLGCMGAMEANWYLQEQGL